MGATAAMIGMCFPGFVFMTIAGFLYAHNGDRPLVTAALKGVAAAAVGLIAATWFQIGKKTVHGFYDAFFILAAIIGINQLKLGVPLTLLVDGCLAIFANRPRKPHTGGKSDKEETRAWIRALR
jgi:chromate transporter